MSTTTCPTCGSPVRIHSGDEGTSSYGPVNRWIKCSERLPERNKVVLLFAKGQQYTGYFFMEHEWANGFFAGNAPHARAIPNVTHWQPMPDGPSETQSP